MRKSGAEMRKTMLKAIIFDMDGVIIDSEEQHARATLQVFEKHGVQTDLEYCTSFIGSSTRHMVEVSIDKFRMDVSPEQLLQEMNDQKTILIHTEGYIPVPGVCQLIQHLHQQNIKLAIASSSSIHEIEQVVKALKLGRYFDKLISSSHVAHPKPAPDVFLLALEKLGIKSTEAIVIEDSELGTLASQAASIPCVGFYNPGSGNQNLSHAAVVVESFENLDATFFSNTLHRTQGEPITIASTRRLLIRELTESDIPNMYEIYQDPDVRKYIDDIDDYREQEVQKLHAYIKNVYSFYGYGLWGVFSKTTHGLIGRCGIENHTIDGKSEIMISYLLDSDHWGYGYALECCHSVLHYAAEELGITRIVAVIDKSNERSIHTATSLDMKPEKELVYQNRDSILYVWNPPAECTQ